jgi:membrane protein DedA with SNARE-associated domain
VDTTIQFLIHHGYLVLFVWVLLEQGGVPIPAVPVLLAAGALAAKGRMHLGIILAAAVTASLVMDLGWYGLGRRQGMRVLRALCRISLEPDTCVRQTQEIFNRRGALSLLVAKFIPGLGTVATPLAGIIRMPLTHFVLFDGLGIFLWVSVFVALGTLFAEQLAGVAAVVATMGAWLAAVLLGGLGTYLLWKFLKRRRFLRRLRVARISPEELKRKIDAGEEVMIADLRHPLEVDAEPVGIPGALRWDPETLASNSPTLSPNQEVILYCS